MVIPSTEKWSESNLSRRISSVTFNITITSNHTSEFRCCSPGFSSHTW